MNASATADAEGRKLFLGGLPFDVRENDLRDDFGKFGELEDVQLPFSDGKHKGFAFITFRDPGDCTAASKDHHQREYRGREISARVVVPRGDPGHPGNERGGSGGGGGERPGDWTCDRCGANVFASKSACFKCGEPKPRGGGGGYGRDRDYDDRRRDRDYDDRRRDRDYDDRRRDGYGRDRDDDRRRDRDDYDRGRDRDDYDRGRGREDDRGRGRDYDDHGDRGRDYDDRGGRDRYDDRR